MALALLLLGAMLAAPAPARGADANTAPVADMISVTVTGGAPATVTLAAYDDDGDHLTFTLDPAQPPSKGTLGAVSASTCDAATQECTATVLYTPTAGGSGYDEFAFIVSDGQETDTGYVDVLLVCGAIVSNGTTQLGVNCDGSLNVPGGTPSSGENTETVGVRYVPTNADATAPGCECEGWGVADTLTEVAGYANVSEGTDGITLLDFTSTATTATSTVRVGSTFDVAHSYTPEPERPNLYRVEVSIKNISAAPTDVRYRRLMDWDVEPTAFEEYVTMYKGNASELVFTSNDGFAPSNPLAGPSDRGLTGSWVDQGPDDHGALFDFAFGTLAPNATKTFTTYYGAAPTEAVALSALAGVGAEAYSLGQPSTPDGPTLGTPNTFMFAFKGVGGTSAFGPAAFPQTVNVVEDTPKEITLSGSHPAGEDLVFSVVSGPADGTVGTVTETTCTGTGPRSCTAKVTYTPGAGFTGNDAFTFQVSDGTQTDTAVVSLVVGDVKKPTATTPGGASTVQYSDVAGLSAVLTDTSVAPPPPLAAKPMTFTLGTQTAGATTNATGTAAASMKVMQQPGTVSSVAAAFAGDATHLPSSQTRAFSVTKEDCALEYTGNPVLPKSGTATLTARMTELDSSVGDLSGKQVKFSVLDVDPAGTATRTFTATTSAAGVASRTVTIPGDLSPEVYYVTASFAGDAFYKSCTAPQEVLTVTAGKAKVTGGGWIDGAHFGFNVIPGKRLKGQLEARGAGKTRFHGSKVSSLEVSGRKATWKGTGKHNGSTGFKFVASVEDKGTPGRGKDTFKLVVRNKSGKVVLSVSGVLRGGNIVVHRR